MLTPKDLKGCALSRKEIVREFGKYTYSYFSQKLNNFTVPFSKEDEEEIWEIIKKYPVRTKRYFGGSR